MTAPALTLCSAPSPFQHGGITDAGLSRTVVLVQPASVAAAMASTKIGVFITCCPCREKAAQAALRSM